MSQDHDMAILIAVDHISERRWLTVGVIKDTDSGKQSNTAVY
jgi:hypothetical protein